MQEPIILPPTKKNRLDRHYTVIYGWIDQNIGSWGIDVREIDLVPSEDKVRIWKDGEAMGLPIPGTWFLTFSEAKRAAIKLWQDKLESTRVALRDIKRQKKDQCVKI